MEREQQISTLAGIITDLRVTGEGELISQNELAESLRDYGGDCFEAWYLFRPNGKQVGVIQNDECVGFYKKILECMDDVSHVYQYGSHEFDAYLARLLTRWINFVNFSK